MGTVKLLGAEASMTVGARVFGNGQFVLQGDPYRGNGELEFTHAVGRGIQVELTGGILRLDEPMRFLGSITLGSDPTDTRSDYIQLPHEVVTSVRFADNQLSLYDLGTLVGKLNVVGSLQTTDFTVGSLAGGGSVIGYSPYRPGPELTGMPSALPHS
jgi:hypothetical protein